MTFALEEEGGRPVNVGSEFPAGDFRVYYFFSYQGMTQGSVWTYGWYRDGVYLDGNTCLWGVRLEFCPRIFGTSGSNFLFFRAPGGYQPGVYEVRVWIEDRLQTNAQFIVR